MANEIITTKDVESKVFTIRNQRVILDCDVAMLYGVETKRVNEAVRNNREKFPEGFIIEFDSEESAVLRSKISSLKHSKGSGSNISKYNYKAFTEKGLYMLATILKSKQAVKTTIAIIETFTMMRNLAQNIEELQDVSLDDNKRKNILLQSGKIMAEAIGANLTTKSVETEIEINLAAIRIKHKIIRKDKEDDKK